MFLSSNLVYFSFLATCKRVKTKQHFLCEKNWKWIEGEKKYCPTRLAVKDGADCPRFEFLIFIRLLCSTDDPKIANKKNHIRNEIWRLILHSSNVTYRDISKFHQLENQNYDSFCNLKLWNCQELEKWLRLFSWVLHWAKWGCQKIK